MRFEAMRASSDRTRLALLGAALIVVVLLPAFFLQRMANDTQQAIALVSHTNELKAEVSKLLADARDLDAATLAIATGFDSPRVRARFADSSRDIKPTLERLIALSRDNPAQQVRIGSLQASLEQRLAVARDIVRDDGDTVAKTRQDVDDMLARFPIRETAQAIVGTEETLLVQRTQAASRQQTQSRILRMVAIVVQLVALTLVALFWLRQLRAREAAEKGYQHANTRALAVLQSVREPIVLLDAEQNVLMHNAAFSELYALGDDNVRRQTIGGHRRWRLGQQCHPAAPARRAAARPRTVGLRAGPAAHRRTTSAPC